MGDPNKLYDIISRLGQGGFGAVYKARHKQTNKLVAVKKIPSHEYESVKKEISLLRECKSPYIIKLLNAHTDHKEKCYWIVLEYCLGGSIEGLAGNCNENKLTKIIINVLNGLKYLHSKQIIHRDIKPHNILLHKSGIYKLGDLGISKLTEVSAAKTRAGTRYYVAPEILKNANNKYDCKVDIWSLGITVYYLATKTYPFKQGSEFQIMMQIVNGVPNKLNVGSNNLKDFVNNKCLQKNAYSRPHAAQLLRHPLFSNNDNNNDNNYDNGDDEKKQSQGGVASFVHWSTTEAYKGEFMALRIPCPTDGNNIVLDWYHANGNCGQPLEINQYGVVRCGKRHTAKFKDCKWKCGRHANVYQVANEMFLANVMIHQMKNFKQDGLQWYWELMKALKIQFH